MHRYLRPKQKNRSKRAFYSNDPPKAKTGSEQMPPKHEIGIINESAEKHAFWKHNIAFAESLAAITGLVGFYAAAEARISQFKLSQISGNSMIIAALLISSSARGEHAFTSGLASKTTYFEGWNIMTDHSKTACFEAYVVQTLTPYLLHLPNYNCCACAAPAENVIVQVPFFEHSSVQCYCFYVCETLSCLIFATSFSAPS